LLTGEIRSFTNGTRRGYQVGSSDLVSLGSLSPVLSSDSCDSLGAGVGVGAGGFCCSSSSSAYGFLVGSKISVGAVSTSVAFDVESAVGGGIYSGS
jgi:hypothetical protein